MKKRTLWLAAGVALFGFSAFIWLYDGEDGSEQLVTTVQEGPFEIRVNTTGELEAKNSVEIKGPKRLRAVGIWRVQISDMVDEGTIVDSGQYIASLDRSEISNKIKEVDTEMQQAESQYTQTRIDTTLDMRQARENLVNLDFQMREKKIALEQSKYEPPATIRQAEIELSKAKKSLEEAKANYRLQVLSAQAKMSEAQAKLDIASNKKVALDEVFTEFEIIAPESGMVIYKRDWNGKRKGVGSEISAWNPVVATLPDLTNMISKTYVNEVDISKISEGQNVEVTLDAFPEKLLSGKVISVANVGEQLKRSDGKVFEVIVEIVENDTTLRPAMTTGNSIVAAQLDSVTFIPLEAVYNEGDSVIFVYKKDGFGISRQEVALGQSNDNYVIVENGLQSGEKVLLSRPTNAEGMGMERLKSGDL